MGMVLLVEADAFEARVIAARLGSEGIVAETRGADGPYPVGQASVWVEAGSLAEAREILMVEEIESSFDDGDALSPMPMIWVWVAALLLVMFVVYARAVT